ncbi:hypothetical protein BGZ46_008507 [Entomortierella lignicola]|nr:hypothetical protein BGZ46_008507 [Entomortierella lignicola]
MKISQLLNPVGSDSDQDIIDPQQSASSPSEEQHPITGIKNIHPYSSQSSKHANPESIEQLDTLATRNNIPVRNSSNSRNQLAPRDQPIYGIESQKSNQNYNTHALWTANQPPTPGEEPPGITPKLPPMAIRDYEHDKGQEVDDQNGNKRKYALSYVSDGAESSSGRENNQGQGQATESPNHLKQEGRDSIEVTPRFERNADGKFRCSWPRCGKEFAVESRLSTHYRIHSGKPPYPCGYPGCNKAFHTSSSLSHHRVVHTDQNLRPFVCRHNRCGATYTQLARLITHQRTTHSGMILFIPQETSSSSSPSTSLIYPSSSDDFSDEYPDTPASATEPRVLTAPVESLLPESTRSSHYSRQSTSSIMPQNQQQDHEQVKKVDKISKQDEEESIEDRDMLLRTEAAIAMASLREGAGSYRGYSHTTATNSDYQK